MKRPLRKMMQAWLALCGLLTVLAAAPALAEPAFAEHKLVIQVSTADPLTQRIALNNAANAQKALGMDAVAIEIVAYGPGLGLLTRGGPLSERVASLAKQNVRFSACENTIAAVARKTGKTPQLVEGVQTVPSGVVRVMELQQQGYAYVRP